MPALRAAKAPRRFARGATALRASLGVRGARARLLRRFARGCDGASRVALRGALGAYLGGLGQQGG